MAVAVAFVVRIAGAGGIALTGKEATFRGGDEEGFIFFVARDRRGEPVLGAWLDALTAELQKFVMAVQIRLLDSPDFALRIGMIAIAVAGLVLMAVAVYELAGPRAGLIAMWFLALEPANVFFSSTLHKEPTMMLAGGLVVFGGAMLWRRHELRWLWPIAADASSRWRPGPTRAGS